MGGLGWGEDGGVGKRWAGSGGSRLRLSYGCVGGKKG